MQKEAERESAKAAADAPAWKGETPARSRTVNRPSAEERRRKTRLKDVEDTIAGLEGELAALSRKLENPPTDSAKVQKLGNEYVKKQGELDKFMKEWEDLHTEILEN